jgi:hypothetical protein
LANERIFVTAGSAGEKLEHSTLVELVGREIEREPRVSAFEATVDVAMWARRVPPFVHIDKCLSKGELIRLRHPSILQYLLRPAARTGGVKVLQAEPLDASNARSIHLDLFPGRW